MTLTNNKKYWLHRKLAVAGVGLIVMSPCSVVRPAVAQDTTVGMAPVGAVDIHSILLFPIANESGSADNDNVGPLLDDAIRLRLANVAKFRIQRFSRLLPSVQVALDNKGVSQSDITPPFSTEDTDKDRAEKIATRVATDAYLLGNIESVTKDPATQKVTIVVTANLFDTSSGNSIRSFGVSGTAAQVAPTDTPAEVLQMAVDNAASQISAQINDIPLVNPNQGQPHPAAHASTAGSLAIVLIAGALLYAAFHHDNNSSSSSSSSSTGTGTGGGTPPQPPIVP